METKSYFFEYQGSRILYWIAGDAKKQTFLFFHGWPGYLLLKSGVIQELAKHFFVIAVQHPGLGKSDPLPSYHNVFEQNAEVAFGILKKEKRDNGKIVVMGQSFGGGVASAFAYKYPEYTKLLIMTDSIMGGGNRMGLWTQFWLHGGPKIAKSFVYLPNFIKKILLWEGMGVRVENNIQLKEILKTVSKRLALIENYAKVLIESNNSRISLLDKPYKDIPIIMLWGDRDGKEFSRYGSCNVDVAKKLFEKMKRRNKNINFIPVHGGHTILYEKPNYVINEILKASNISLRQ